MSHKLAYEYVLADLATMCDASAATPPAPPGHGSRTGARLAFECTLLILPILLVLWASASWARVAIAPWPARYGSFAYYAPELLLFLSAAPHWLHRTLLERRDSTLPFKARLAAWIRPLPRLAGSYLIYVVASVALVDTAYVGKLGGFWATHGMAWAVAAPLIALVFYEQFAEQRHARPNVYSGYRILSPDGVAAFCRSACHSHVRHHMRRETE